MLVIALFYWIEQKWIIKTKEGLRCCQVCWLRMSGFHYWMFKLRCLVFPFHWLKGQAGLCLGTSHLPSRFPVKGVVMPSAAYLRSHYGISCPFYFDHAGMAVEMRTGSVTAHWQFTLRQPFLLDVYPPGWVENTAWILGDRRISLHPFTCFVFQVEYHWTYPKLFLHFFVGSLSLHLICPQFFFKAKSKASKCVLLSEEWEIKSLHCVLIVAWSLFCSFKKSSFIEFGKLMMFLHQSTGHHCFSAEYWSMLMILIDPKH